MKWINFLVLFIIIPSILFGQVILLQNPSFEDIPGNSRTPHGWFYCGEQGETPTDVHPAGIFGVTHEPKHGRTFIGMVARESGTWEGISQWLSEPLEAGQCYEFSIETARSPTYESISRVNWQMKNFDQPLRLLIWGGNLNCEKQELLATSSLIEHTDWHSQVFHFQPTASFSRLLLEVQYAEGAEPYCGNLLLDHASPIVPVDCGNRKPIALLEKIMIPQISNVIDLQSFVHQKASQIRFSEVDYQLEQHAFYLPSGELEQGNQYLYTIVKAAQQTDFRYLRIFIPAENKIRFQTKAMSVLEALRILGLSDRQYRLKRSKEKFVKIELH